MTEYYCNAVGSAVIAPVGTQGMGGGAHRASLSAKEPDYWAHCGSNMFYGGWRTVGWCRLKRQCVTWGLQQYNSGQASGTDKGKQHHTEKLIKKKKKSYLAIVPSFKKKKEKKRRERRGKKRKQCWQQCSGSSWPQDGEKTGFSTVPQLTVPSSPSAFPLAWTAAGKELNVSVLGATWTVCTVPTEKLCDCNAIKVISFVALFAQPESEHCLVFIGITNRHHFFFFC